MTKFTSFTLCVMALLQCCFVNKLEAKENVDRYVFGILNSLNDSQVRNRLGRHDCDRDASDVGDGCSSLLQLNFEQLLPAPFSLFLPNELRSPSMLPVKNYLGEWTGTIHFAPNFYGNRKSLFEIQESSSFITGYVLFPLFFFKDLNGTLEGMKKLGIYNIQEFYRRGDSINYWPTLKPKYASTEYRYGSPNVPPELIKAVIKLFSNPLTRPIFERLGHIPMPWLKKMLSDENPMSYDAFQHIANDADTSAVALTAEILANRENSTVVIDNSILPEYSKFRDIDRRREEPQDERWKWKNTGAFLTWFRDENTPDFSDPSVGYIPNLTNNVDCVLNANVLLSIGLAAQQGIIKSPADVVGYNDSCSTLARVATENLYPVCGIYYPINNLFPYSLSRAYRDGRISCDGKLDDSIVSVVARVMKERKKDIDGDIYWEGGKFDGSTTLATSYGILTLLNAGEDIWKRVQGYKKEDFQVTLDSAVRYLKLQSKCDAIAGRVSCMWDDGVFFIDPWYNGAWKGVPYTNAVVLEVLTKYLLNYEQDPATNIFKGKKIEIQNYQDREYKIVE